MAIDLDELERLAKAATPGPWEYRLVGRQANIIMADTEPLCATKYSHNKSHDAAYIVAACNAVPELVARIRELERQREFFIEALDKEHLCPRICWPDGSSADMQNCIEMNAKACWIRAYKQAAKEAGE